MGCGQEGAKSMVAIISECPRMVWLKEVVNFFPLLYHSELFFPLLYMLLLLWLLNTKGQWVSIATHIAVRWKSPPFIGGGWMLGAFMDRAGLGQSLSQPNPFIYCLTGPIFMPAYILCVKYVGPGWAYKDICIVPSPTRLIIKPEIRFGYNPTSPYKQRPIQPNAVGPGSALSGSVHEQLSTPSRCPTQN